MTAAMASAPYKPGPVLVTGPGTPPTGAWPVYDGCDHLTIHTPQYPTIGCTIAWKDAVGTPRGVIWFFSGNDGNAWWSREHLIAETFIQEECVEMGYTTGQVKWDDPGWFDQTFAQGNHFFGSAQLASRSASIIRYLWATFSRGQLDNLTLTGHSGGSSQIAYALGCYGQSAYVQHAVWQAGPPHAGIANSCAGVADYVELAGRNKFDRGMGYVGNDLGPCAIFTPGAVLAARWEHDACDTARRNLLWTDTRVYAQFGTTDETGSVTAGQDMVSALRAAGTPVTVQEIVGQSHGINFDGLAALGPALRDEPIQLEEQDFTGSGTSFAVTFGTGGGDIAPVPQVGSLLLFAMRYTVTAANVTTPAGWTRDGSKDGTGVSVVAFRKIATGSETGVTFATTGASTTHGNYLEVANLPDAVLDRSRDVAQAVGIGGTATFPATLITTASKEFVIAMLGEGAASTITAWGGGLVATGSGNRMHTATLNLRDPAIVTASATYSAATEVAGLVLTYKTT